ncbi:MAG: hypothetical protein JO246_01565, partial [Frankiaceae bacterium]|nr:hypothetical protein [Frankiaceae bacterium]
MTLAIGGTRHFDRQPEKMGRMNDRDVPYAPRRPWRAAVLIAGGAGVVLLVGVLNALGVSGPYRSNATISSTEEARIASYFLA